MSKADSAVRQALRGVGKHLYRYREPYLGAGLGAAAGGALGYLPKKRHRGYDGRRLKRPAERSKGERALHGVAGAAAGGLLGLRIGGILYDARAYKELEEEMNRARKAYQRAHQKSREEWWRNYRQNYQNYQNRHYGSYSGGGGGSGSSRSHYSGGGGGGGSGSSRSHYGGYSGGGTRPRFRTGPTPSEAASAFGHSGSFKTKKDVAKAFRAAAKKHHPDVGGSTEKMQQISSIYDRVKKSDWYQKLAFADPFMAFFTYAEKTAGTPFLKQDRPAKVKSIYKALKRDHPNMPEEVKARIASRKGKKTPESRKSPKDGGPSYKAPLGYTRKGKRYVRSD